VPLVWAREFNADQAKLNPRGRDRPGASPRRVRHAPDGDDAEPPGGDRRPLRPANLCEGGGMANATIIERI